MKLTELHESYQLDDLPSFKAEYYDEATGKEPSVQVYYEVEFGEAESVREPYMHPETTDRVDIIAVLDAAGDDVMDRLTSNERRGFEDRALDLAYEEKESHNDEMGDHMRDTKRDEQL